MHRAVAVLLAAVLVFGLVGCSAPKLGGADRVPLSNEERVDLLNKLDSGNQTTSGSTDLYNENGIIVTADHKLEVESWKLQELSKAYGTQNVFAYIEKTVELPKQTGDWMTSAVTTKDFDSTVRLYGDDTSMTLDIKLSESAAGKYIIAPQGCIINGVLKDKVLFKSKEVTKGHFLITADMAGFKDLEMFGLTMGNISSIAWYLTAIDTETKEMKDFLVASAFPDDKTWQGLRVADKFSASSGIVMWVMRSGDSSYLCVFNGSAEKIASDIKVTATSGSMISTDFKLDVSSGEFSYLKIGYNVKGVVVTKDKTTLFKE